MASAMARDARILSQASALHKIGLYTDRRFVFPAAGLGTKDHLPLRGRPRHEECGYVGDQKPSLCRGLFPEIGTRRRGGGGGACAETRTTTGRATAADAAGVLKVSVGSLGCDLCICDTNLSGSITAGDARCC